MEAKLIRKAHFGSREFFAYSPLAWESSQLTEEFAKVEPMDMRNRIMELTNPWIEAGKLQGIQQGETDIVLRLLGRRFGSLSDSVAESIRSLPREKVEELAEPLLDFTSRDDLAAWLRRNVQ